MNFNGMFDNVMKIFDWTPVSVSSPTEVYVSYRDKGRVLLGYEVTVTYKYHGERKYLFAHDEDKLAIVSCAQARKNAQDFYNVKKQQIKQR